MKDTIALYLAVKENISFRIAILCLKIANVMSAFSWTVSDYFVSIGDRLTNKYLVDDE
jgi:hypothetical protein